MAIKPLPTAVKNNLMQRAKRSKTYTYTDLAKVYRRGQGAYLGAGSRPGVSQQQWAYGRVRSFLAGGRHDQDIRRAAKKRGK